MDQLQTHNVVTPEQVEAFIAKWRESGGSERANYVSFLNELCDIIEVPRPDAKVSDDIRNDYVFEREVLFTHADGKQTTGRIDLYKRDCFVLEAKQGVDAEMIASAGLLGSGHRRVHRGHGVRGSLTWDAMMERARLQAERYARALPVDHGWPPFLIVVDVGARIELFADFTRQGKTYTQFPDAQGFRISLNDLARPAVRAMLRSIWTQPMLLDPSLQSAKVTRDVAERLAKLAKVLEQDGHQPTAVAEFLTRCLFCMFAEDVSLLPSRRFTLMLEQMQGRADRAHLMLEDLWRAMDRGGFFTNWMQDLLRFNGWLFRSTTALQLNEEQLGLLIQASHCDWTNVEPAIFGTLMERALNPDERHSLGAHYTPRAYVERLVLPTVIEPIREEWTAVQAAAFHHASQSEIEPAYKLVSGFHKRLCEIRILDPACGTGNFLYVTLEHMKRIEGEVLDVIGKLGGGTLLQRSIAEGYSVSPAQFLGIELNARAANLAKLVLWIGYLQWHFRNRGANVKVPEPVMQDISNIQCRDAVLMHDGFQTLCDESGKPITRWDGKSYKPSPVTGEPIPDESAIVLVEHPTNPRKAQWPQADFVVGNPPFIGNKRMRMALGDGYALALRETWPEVPESADFVMYWWHHAAELTREGQLRRFGLITTNSLPQAFNRRVVQTQMEAQPPLSLLFAIPDHPWVDSTDGAAVRISMTVGTAGTKPGRLLRVSNERYENGRDEVVVTLTEKRGKIHPDLKTGADVNSATLLKANEGLANRGVIPHGEGFFVTPDEIHQWPEPRPSANLLRPYLNGRDLNQVVRGVFVFDTYGIDESRLRTAFPAVYQRLLERVKPERDQNPRKTRRDRWWLFGENQPRMRASLAGLPRFIVLPYTSKHRFCVFMPSDVLPDDGLIAVGISDAFYLGVLSSRIHVVWALFAGGRLGVGNDSRYNKSTCFDAFPFPEADEVVKEQIRGLAEELDAHRKRQQAAHVGLTLTGMYNVLEKLRSGEALTGKERVVYEQGLVGVLKSLHDRLDEAVFAAYGWPAGLTDDEILERLVELNHERAAEEAEGRVRWLRPEFQSPELRAKRATQGQLMLGTALTEEAPAEEGEPESGVAEPAKKRGKKAVAAKAQPGVLPWPETVPEQVLALRGLLSATPGSRSPSQWASFFTAAPVSRVAELLDTLVALSLAHRDEDGGIRE